MPGDQQRINVPALVLLAILSGGTASIAGIKFSWVQPDEHQAITNRDIGNIEKDIDELKENLRTESNHRRTADAALNAGFQQVSKELIEFREKCKHVEWRCQRLERGFSND